MARVFAGNIMALVAALTILLLSGTYPPGLFPPGFLVFCQDHPAECEPVEPAVISLSDWREVLERVNVETNASITYTPEDDDNADSWNIVTTHGDCDDYTVTKRQKLIEAGIPRGAMRAAYVLPVNEISHVFLVVSTTDGHFVLDNNTDEILDLERQMLLRLSIQDASDPRVWWQVY